MKKKQPLERVIADFWDHDQLKDGQFHHIIINYKEGKYSFYIDGKEVQCKK